MEPTATPLDVARSPSSSRSCSAVGGSRSSTSTPARRRRSPSRCSTRWTDSYRHSNANIHRGVYPLAQEATDAFEGAPRRESPRWIGADVRGDDLHEERRPRRSTSSPTPGAARNVGAGDAIVLTQMEHHSNIVPWQLLCQEVGARARATWRSTTTAGSTSTRSTRELAARRRKLVARHPRLERARHAQPDRRDRRAARTPPARACSSTARRPCRTCRVDVGAIGADFYGFTGHKVYGPTGIGVLHGRRELLEEMPPFLGGGDMISLGRLPRVELERAALEVRGGHLADRRGRRPRRRGRVPRRRSASTPCARTSST